MDVWTLPNICIPTPSIIATAMNAATRPIMVLDSAIWKSHFHYIKATWKVLPTCLNLDILQVLTLVCLACLDVPHYYSNIDGCKDSGKDNKLSREQEPRYRKVQDSNDKRIDSFMVFDVCERYKDRD